MKLTIDRSVLSAALATVKSVVPSKSNLPILTHFLLHQKGSELDVTACDLDITVRTTVGCTNTAKKIDSSCTVPAALFASLVGQLTDAPIELELVKHQLKLSSGSSTYHFGTMDPGEYCAFPDLKNPVEFDLPQAVLRQLLSQTSFAQSSDDSRYVLCGSYMQVNGKLTVVATDGRRIAVEDADVEKDLPETNMLMPIKAVRELQRLLAGEPKEGESVAPPVRVAIAANMGRFTLQDTVFITKLTEGTYPNYKAVIPEARQGVLIARADLLGAVKRVSLVSETCILEFDRYTLTVRSGKEKEGSGEGMETLPIPCSPPSGQHSCCSDSPKATVSFNGQFMIEALDAIEDDQICIQVADEITPALLTAPGKTWQCAIAPIRLVKPEATI